MAYDAAGTLLWSTPFSAPGTSSAAVGMVADPATGGVIVTGRFIEADIDVTIAYGPTGQQLWLRQDASGPYNTTIAYNPHDDSVVLVRANQTLSLAAATGQLRWENTTDFAD